MRGIQIAVSSSSRRLLSVTGRVVLWECSDTKARKADIVVEEHGIRGAWAISFRIATYDSLAMLAADALRYLGLVTA